MSQAQVANFSRGRLAIGLIIRISRPRYVWHCHHATMPPCRQSCWALDTQRGALQVMQSFVLAPAPGMSEVVLEPYNSALCFQDLLEYTDQVPWFLICEKLGQFMALYIFRGVKHVFQSVSPWERPMFHRVSSVSSQTFDLEVFLFDNRALTEVCQKALDQDMPKMTDLNQVLAVKWGVVQVRCNCDDVFPSLVEILKLCPKSIPWKSWWVSTLFWQLSCGCSGSVFSISWDHFEWYERLHLLHIPKLALFPPFNSQTSKLLRWWPGACLASHLAWDIRGLWMQTYGSCKPTWFRSRMPTFSLVAWLLSRPKHPKNTGRALSRILRNRCFRKIMSPWNAIL